MLVILREKYHSHAHIIYQKKETMCKEQQALHPIFLSTLKSNEFGRYASKPSKELYKNNYENDKRSMFFQILKCSLLQ
jgi:hypothetical protein